MFTPSRNCIVVYTFISPYLIIVLSICSTSEDIGRSHTILYKSIQDKICEMITIKQLASNCPDFDVQFRPFFED